MTSITRLAVSAAAVVFCAAAPGGITAPPPGTGLDAHDAEIRRVEEPRTPGAEGNAGKTLEQMMKDLTTPALSIAVVKDYQIVWAKAWGDADVQAGRKANVETLFQAASISKPVAAMGVLKAVQDGAFGLDDDINSILKSWKLIQEQEFLTKTKVTPRLLMSMTAGATVSGFPGTFRRIRSRRCRRCSDTMQRADTRPPTRRR